MASPLEVDFKTFHITINRSVSTESVLSVLCCCRWTWLWSTTGCTSRRSGRRGSVMNVSMLRARSRGWRRARCKSKKQHNSTHSDTVTTTKTQHEEMMKKRPQKMREHTSESRSEFESEFLQCVQWTTSSVIAVETSLTLQTAAWTEAFPSLIWGTTEVSISRQPNLWSVLFTFTIQLSTQSGPQRRFSGTFFWFLGFWF